VIETTDGLSSETEELLRRARFVERFVERMPTTHKRRLKGAVLARIAFASTTLAVGQAAVSATGLAAKTVVGLALVGSLGAGSYLALRPPRHHAPASPAHFVSSLPRAVAPSPRAVAPSPAPSPVAAVVDVPPPIVRAHHFERHVAPAPASTLAAETTLLRDADRALRAGDTATALARLDEHAARFPRGVLAPERAGERLVVLCELGAADPRAVSQFLAARSGAPLAARVRRACAPTP
jgi:hypothetical protein